MDYEYEEITAGNNDEQYTYFETIEVDDDPWDPSNYGGIDYPDSNAFGDNDLG